MKWILPVLIAVTFIAWCASSIVFAQDATTQPPPQQQTSDWTFSLQGTYYYGSVDGYVQTPSGGEPGTTSDKRPKLDEIGISNTSIYDIAGIAAHDREEFYGGAQIIQMSGSDTLKQTLVSQAVTFPAGTHVSSDVDLNWYRAGYRHRFSLGSGGADNEWTIWPSAGAILWDASYRLRGGGGERASRTHTQGNLQFGLETEWRPHGGPFSLDASFLAAPPIADWPEIYVEQLVASYRLIDRQNSDLSIFGGVMWEQQYYEDNQTVSNRIEANFGPMLVVGLQWRF